MVEPDRPMSGTAVCYWLRRRRRYTSVDGVNAATRRVQKVHPASRDIALGTNGSRPFQKVGTGSIPATSTLIMPLTCNDAVQRSRIPLPPPPLRGNGFRVFSAY